jgi:flagellar biosynthesis/type III secretory pathway M-ring protein FliF/YscJ
MNEFKFWMIIVSLLIFCIMVLSFMVFHVEKRINKADAMILRLEEKERKRNEKPRTDPKPDTD